MMTLRVKDSNMMNERSQRGYSFSELLVTMAIMVLVSVIMATGIPVVIRAYQGVVDSANAQLLLSTATVRLRDVLSVADPQSIKPGSGNTLISFTSLDTGLVTTLTYDEDLGICISEDKPSLPGDTTPSPSTPTPLVQSKAGIGAKSDLKIYCGGITPSASNDAFTVSNLKVYQPQPNAETPSASTSTQDGEGVSPQDDQQGDGGTAATQDDQQGDGGSEPASSGPSDPGPAVAGASFETLTVRVLAAPRS